LTLVGYIKVTRPPLTILGGLAPLALVLWSGKPLVWEGLLIVLAVFFGNMGYTMMNECMDIDVDAKNKPYKPLPSGQADWEKVFMTSILLITLSIVYDCVYLVGCLGLALSYVYNVLRKDLLGNVCMAGAYGIAALISLYPRHLLFPLAFALLTLAFNGVVAWQDMKAERLAGITTLPIQLGGRTFPVVIILSACSVILFSVLPLPFLTKYTFMTSGALVILGALGILFSNLAFPEIFCRISGRVLLMISFILLMLNV